MPGLRRTDATGVQLMDASMPVSAVEEVQHIALVHLESRQLIQDEVHVVAVVGVDIPEIVGKCLCSKGMRCVENRLIHRMVLTGNLSREPEPPANRIVFLDIREKIGPIIEGNEELEVVQGIADGNDRAFERNIQEVTAQLNVLVDRRLELSLVGRLAPRPEVAD